MSLVVRLNRLLKTVSFLGFDMRITYTYLMNLKSKTPYESGASTRFPREGFG